MDKKDSLCANGGAGEPRVALSHPSHPPTGRRRRLGLTAGLSPLSRVGWRCPHNKQKPTGTSHKENKGGACRSNRRGLGGGRGKEEEEEEEEEWEADLFAIDNGEEDQLDRAPRFPYHY